MINIFEIFGWIGSGLILLAYYGTSTKKIEANGRMSVTLNFFGATGLIIYGIYLETWPPLIVNIVWAILTIYSGINKKDNGRI